MIYVIIGLLAVIAAEAAGALLLAARRTGAPREKTGEGRAPGGEEFEKRWQEGMSSMMSYDLMAARRAVRSDGEDER